MALQRAAQYKSVVVLGSATPALESFCRARRGGPYKLLRLTQRVDHRELPQVHIVDLREELARGNTGIFSNTLKKALSKRIVNKTKKYFLFLTDGAMPWLRCFRSV